MCTNASLPWLIIMRSTQTRINLGWLYIDTIHAVLGSVGLTTVAVGLSLLLYEDLFKRSLVQHHPTFLDATCWSRLNTMLDDVE